MSKAAVIIKTPKYCNTCVFREYIHGTHFCMATLPRLELGVLNDKIPRSVRCPLKPIPNKKDLSSEIPSIRFINGKPVDSYVLGFNDCIDEILRDCKTCGHSNDGKCAGTEECHYCMWVNNYIEADKEKKND